MGIKNSSGGSAVKLDTGILQAYNLLLVTNKKNDEYRSDYE